jgi:hypothetical protein
MIEKTRVQPKLAALPAVKWTRMANPSLNEQESAKA